MVSVITRLASTNWSLCRPAPAAIDWVLLQRRCHGQMNLSKQGIRWQVSFDHTAG